MMISLLILILFCLRIVKGSNEEAVLTPRDVAHPEDMLKSVSVSKKDQLKIPRSIVHGEGARGSVITRMTWRDGCRI